jgi:hypothetical protein
MTLTSLALADSPEMKAALAEYAHELLLYRSHGVEVHSNRWVVLLTRRVRRASWPKIR